MIADLLDNAFLNKLREAIREVEKFADKIAGDVTAVIQAVKCCLPDPIQMGLNALNVVMEAFFCPLTKAVGVLEDLIMQVANKFVTTIVNMIPDSEEYTLGVDLGHYNSHFYVPSCSGHMSLNLDMDFSYTIGTRQLKNALKSRFSGIEAEDSALKHTSDWHSMVSFSYHSVVDCWRIGSDKVMSITDTCDCDLWNALKDLQVVQMSAEVFNHIKNHGSQYGEAFVDSLDDFQDFAGDHIGETWSHASNGAEEIGGWATRTGGGVVNWVRGWGEE